MVYKVHQAKTNLSRLLKEACAGKNVIIARGNEPIARIVAIPSRKNRKKRIPGGYEDQAWAAPGAFDPLTDEEMKELGFE
jgi:prevent-host-death family protein